MPFLRVFLSACFFVVASTGALGQGLAELRASLIGEWAFNEGATRALPHDLGEHPWIEKRIDKMAEDGMNFSFSKDGICVISDARGDDRSSFLLFADVEGNSWIAIGNEDFVLGRLSIAAGTLRLFLVARDEEGGEFPVIGEIVLDRE